MMPFHLFALTAVAGSLLLAGCADPLDDRFDNLHPGTFNMYVDGDMISGEAFLTSRAAEALVEMFATDGHYIEIRDVRLAGSGETAFEPNAVRLEGPAGQVYTLDRGSLTVRRSAGVAIGTFAFRLLDEETRAVSLEIEGGFHAVSGP
jgi:hypothetical protein